MWCTIDIERAHTAYTLAAVVVEDERLFALVDELLIEHVEHLKEAGIIRDVMHLLLLEVAFVLWAVLLPILYCE